jgi:hypothetical protein
MVCRLPSGVLATLRRMPASRAEVALLLLSDEVSTVVDSSRGVNEASRLLCRFHIGCTWGLRAA